MIAGLAWVAAGSLLIVWGLGGFVIECRGRGAVRPRWRPHPPHGGGRG